MSDDKPVKLELWAVPDGEGRWVGVIVSEGREPIDRGTGIVRDVGTYRDTGFYDPDMVAERVQALLRNLGEGKVGR